MDYQRLKQVIIEQQDIHLDNTIERAVHAQLHKLQNTKEIIVITGIRRCGKSTVLQQLRAKNGEANNYYFNFDDDRLVNFKLEDFQILLELFVELYGVQKKIYFDEIQNIAGWERFIRRLHDQGNKIYLTGSNATMFSRELGTRLTGRYIQINMYPFSFYEYVNWQQPQILSAKSLTTNNKGNFKNLFANFINSGGLPEFLLSENKEYLSALYESILYRDVIVRYKINERAIKELGLYLASNIAKEITYNSLRKMLGLASPSTVSDYCKFLENSFLCFFINRYSFSLKRQVHYAKKIFFIDQALAKTVGFQISEDAGRVLENIVFLELKQRGCEIYFHKDEYECDFLIKEGMQIVQALQVTCSLTNEGTKQRELRGLLEALQLYKLKVGYILTENESYEEEVQYENQQYTIKIIPIWKWLLQLND